MNMDLILLIIGIWICFGPIVVLAIFKPIETKKGAIIKGLIGGPLMIFPIIKFWNYLFN